LHYSSTSYSEGHKSEIPATLIEELSEESLSISRSSPATSPKNDIEVIEREDEVLGRDTVEIAGGGDDIENSAVTMKKMNC
jgi:hypothetical protein